MNGTTTFALVLCGVNLTALVALLVAGRRRARTAPRAPARPAAELERPAGGRAPSRPGRPVLPSVEDLVEEAEEAERLAARGESRLARDLARWREQGKAVPVPAADRRPAAGAGGW
jgi:hypothetical protein